MAKKDKKQDQDAGNDQDSSENGDEPKLKPLSPIKRKRLQKCFEHGSMLSGKGEFDYADQMFRQCVAGDPGNLIYTQNLLTNLIKKYNNNKKGGKLSGIKGAGAKASMKKAQMKKDWPGVIKAGAEVLHHNPWDVSTLTEMAKACGALEVEECQIAYFKMALDGDPKDLSLNRLAAAAFADAARFDDAIKCLERIAAQKPNDQELQREISQMTVQKTIHKGGYEAAETSLDVSVEKQTQDKMTGGGMELSEEQQLRREIRRHPEEVTNFISLANYFFKLEDFEAAEQVMQQGVEATDAVRAREELEDIQLYRARLELLRAQKRAAEKKSKESVELYRKMKEELNKRELAVFAARGERYPGDYGLKYELGLRLKRAGKYEQAIKEFQQARNDTKRCAAANLETGECFQQIKQFKLAINSYEEALEACGPSDREVQKLALYRAGWLCKGLKDYVNAEKFLSQLASIDFGYKDTSQMLDEVSKKNKES